MWQPRYPGLTGAHYHKALVEFLTQPFDNGLHRTDHFLPQAGGKTGENDTLSGGSAGVNQLSEIFVLCKQNSSSFQGQSSDFWIGNTRIHFDDGDNVVPSFPEGSNRPKIERLVGKEFHLRCFPEIRLKENGLLLRQNLRGIEQRGLNIFPA